MARCDLRIELEGDRTTYRAGDTVRGTVVVSTRGTIRCDGLAIEIGWETSGAGSTTGGGRSTAALFQGEWTDVERRYPFSFELPDGPVTYDGKLIEVGWFLRARADVPGKIDPKDEVEIELVPEPGREMDWRTQYATERLPSRTYEPIGGNQPENFPIELIRTETGEDPPGGAATWKNPFGKGCMTVLGIAFALLGIWMSIRVLEAVEIWRGGDWMFAVEKLVLPAGYFGFLVVMLVIWIRWRMNRSRLGKVEVKIEEPRVRRGENLRVRISCAPEKALTLKRATASLRARERVTFPLRRSPRSIAGARPRHQRRPRKRDVYEGEVEIGSTHELSARVPFSLDGLVPIPPDGPPSFDSPHNEVTWTVKLTLHVTAWPDWSQKREIVVTP